MEIWECLKNRRSVRHFTSQVPSLDLLRQIIEYATLAPNAMNSQDWHFTIVTSPSIREKLYLAVQARWQNLCTPSSTVHSAVLQYAGNFTSFAQAPAVIVVHTRRPPGFLQQMIGANTEMVMGCYASACMAVENLLLAAHALGLGSCVYTGCNAAEADILSLLDIGKQRQLVCLVALGYPQETPPMPKRKELEKVMTVVE